VKIYIENIYILSVALLKVLCSAKLEVVCSEAATCSSDLIVDWHFLNIVHDLENLLHGLTNN
jgi:hypothetical protein